MEEFDNDISELIIQNSKELNNDNLIQPVEIRDVFFSVGDYFRSPFIPIQK